MPRSAEQKYPITVYELDNGTSLTEYRRILRKKVADQRQKAIKDSGLLRLNQGVEIYYISYINTVDSQDTKWHKPWRTFFSIDEPLLRNSRTGHGVIIVHFIEGQKKFALIFGRSFSLLKEYYKWDFGISLATKIFDKTSIEVASSKFFSMIKNKQIIDYKEEYSLQTDEGQAVDFLQARITEDYLRRENLESQYINELLSLVKPDASAGYAFVKLTVYGNIITLDLILEVLGKLSKIQEYDDRFELPMIKMVTRSKSNELDTFLLNSIKAEEDDISISVPFFGFDESDKFAFFDDIEEFKLFYGEIAEEYNGKLNKEDIEEFILENCDSILNMRELYVSVSIAGEYSSKVCILRWVDSDIDIDDRNYALYDGEWVEFNQVYLDYLQNSVEELEAECLVDKPELSFSSEEVIYYREHFPNELMDRFYRNGEGTIEGVYKEFVYNYALSQKENWLLFDRRFGNKIEICDLYVRNEQYVHVKIGDSSGLDEVLRQSMLGLRFAEQNRYMWTEFTDYEGEAISDANTCCVIFLSENRTGEIPRLAENRSLRCKITFVDWVTFMKERRKTPRIYIGVFTTDMHPENNLHLNLDGIVLD